MVLVYPSDLQKFLISMIRDRFSFLSIHLFSFFSLAPGKFLTIFQRQFTVLVSKKSPVNLINRLVFSDPFHLWLQFE